MPEKEPMPLVTVITVTYNSAIYVKDAIDSILHSSYTHFELIVGDDCSSDDTWRIVQSYTDIRIRSYRNEVNLGEYPNRNKAIEMAKGEYLLFIDGDDMIYPHGLEFMVRMLDAFPDCAMALMTWFRSKLFYPIRITPEQFYLSEYFNNGFLGTAFSNVLFRTQVLRHEEFLSLRYRSGDNFIRYKIAAKNNSLLINDDLTWWRETPGQASQTISKDRSFLLESYQMKFEFLNVKECPLGEKELSLARHNLYLTLSRQIISYILKGKVGYAYLLRQRLKIPFKYLFKFYEKQVVVDVFKDYSATNPCRLAFDRNPYSSFFINK